MSLALDLQADVAELLDDPDYGRDIIVRRKVNGVYDMTTGEITRGDLEYPTRAVILSYRDHNIDGTIIKQGDRKVVMSSRDVPMVPQIADEIVVGDDTYAVMNAKQTELGGENIIFVCQVRKG